MKDWLGHANIQHTTISAGEAGGARAAAAGAPRWFHKWWSHYVDWGPEGLYDLTRANHQVMNRTPPHIERAVLSIRRRLAV